MPYPTTITTDTASAGTSTLSSPDHSSRHNTIGSAVIAMETVVGTTLGTSIAKNFASGDFAARINASNVPQQALNAGTFGTAILGTPAITGGTVGTARVIGGTVSGVIVGTSTMQGGTANGVVMGTPTIGTIAVPGTVAALSFSAAIAPGIGTVADSAGGTLTVNAQAGQVFYSAQGTAAGSRTIAAPLNATGYQNLTYAFKTSGSANSTLIWNAIFKFSQDIGTPALGTGVGWNYYGWRYNFIDTKWDFQGNSKNLI